MKIAVTGGSGRVGRAIVDLALKQGDSVVSIDRVNSDDSAVRSNIHFIQAEITDYSAVENALRGCDALVHMAAIPAPGNQPDDQVHNNNVMGSYNAMRAAVEVGISKICQASSVNAAGLAYSRWPRFDYFPLDESTPHITKTPTAFRNGSASNRETHSRGAMRT